MSCKNCIWLIVPPSKSGRRLPRKDGAYKCDVTIPEAILPASVRTHYGFMWPPAKRWMSADDGDGCQLFEPLPKNR